MKDVFTSLEQFMDEQFQIQFKAVGLHAKHPQSSPL